MIFRGEDSIKRASVGHDVNSINFAAALCLPLGVVLRENISLTVYRGDVGHASRGGAELLSLQRKHTPLLNRVDVYLYSLTGG